MSSDEPRVAAETCPQCGAGLPADWTDRCPYCGVRLVRPQPAQPAEWPAAALPPGLAEAAMRGLYGREYRSRATLLGLPLLHIAQGLDPQTGRPRVARGIIAIGNSAYGVIALGGFAVGGIAIGGAAVGVVAVGGVALGGAALGGLAAGVAAAGGMALALWLALGGLVISAQYAIGGLALAPHALGGNAQDPALLRWLERLFSPEGISR